MHDNAKFIEDVEQAITATRPLHCDAVLPANIVETCLLDEIVLGGLFFDGLQRVELRGREAFGLLTKGLQFGNEFIAEKLEPLAVHSFRLRAGDRVEIDDVRIFALQRLQVEADRHHIGFVADQQDWRAVAESAHMLQPVFCLFIRVALGAARKHDHIKTFRAQKKLVRGVRHDLTAEIPEMNGQVVVLVVGNTGEDARLLMNCVLDGNALRHRLLALDNVLPMQRADQRGLADFAMADEDGSHALELLCELPVAKRLEISVNFSRSFELNAFVSNERPLPLDLPIEGPSVQPVLIPIDPDLESCV